MLNPFSENYLQIEKVVDDALQIGSFTLFLSGGALSGEIRCLALTALLVGSPAYAVMALTAPMCLMATRRFSVTNFRPPTLTPQNGGRATSTPMAPSITSTTSGRGTGRTITTSS